MGYGFKVNNIDDTVIVDGTYKNFSFYESGSVTTTGGSPTTVSFATATASLPLVALRPTEVDTLKGITLIGYTKSGSNWTGFVICNILSSLIYYKVYVSSTPTASEGYGLKVYNSSSDIVFDSSYKYFDIHSVTSVTILKPSLYVSYDVTHTDISNPYYFLSPVGAWIYGQGHGGVLGPIVFLKSGVSRLSSTSVRVLWIAIKSGVVDEFIDEGWNPTMSLIILK